MKRSSKDKPVALVTGAARRIGAAIASHLHDAGYRLVLHYHRSHGAALKLAEQLCAADPGSAALVQADLSEAGGPEQLFAAALTHYQRVDLLVNNASSFFATPVGQIELDDWERLFASNARGPLFLCQAAANELGRRQGAIINLIDVHAGRPLRGHTVYCMAKAALEMMTLSLAQELAPRVRVNGVAPGAILWPEGDLDQEAREKLLNKIALKRRGDPADIAGAVLYLARDAGYVTGQVLVVDGGRSLNM